MSTSPPSPFHVHAFLARLREMGLRVQKNGSGWLAQCPAHPDRNPSMTIGVGDAPDYKVLVNCKAGCLTKAVCEAMGDPSMAIMFKVQESVGGIKKAPPRLAAPKVAARKPAEPKVERIFNPVEEYLYTDEQGVVLSKAIRLVDQFGEKSFTQRAADGTPSLKGVRRVLYRLHEWSGKKKTLVFAEGEKDVETLRGFKFPATTNMGGAKSWNADYIEQMKAGGVENLVVLYDNDPAGREHGKRVTREAHEAGIMVRLVTLPGVGPKGDITDWKEAGGTREQLIEIIKATPHWTPTEVEIVNPDDDERHMIETEPFPGQARLGMAHEFASLFTGRSDAPYEFLYMSFLTALSAACSPYVKVGAGFTSQRIGLYTVLIGASYGGRKTASRQWALELFEGLESPWNTHLFVPDAIPGSDVGLIKLAKKTEGRPMLMNPDEFSELTGKAAIKGSTYTELLNKLFDSQRIGGISKTFDIEAKVEFSLLSATTDALWTESFTSNTMQVGFLNRLFRVPAYRTQALTTVQQPDAAGIKEIRARVARVLRRLGAKPVTLDMSPEAQTIYAAWFERCRAAKVIYFEDFQRVEAYVQRMAAVLTVAEWGEHPLDVSVEPVISPLAMEIACSLGDWQYRARLWSRPVNADNPYAIREAQLRAYLAKVLREPVPVEGGPPRVPSGRAVRQRQVQQHFSHWGATAFKWAVNAMASSQEIEVEGDAKKGEEVLIRVSDQGLFSTLR